MVEDGGGGRGTVIKMGGHGQRYRVMVRNCMAMTEVVGEVINGVAQRNMVHGERWGHNQIESAEKAQTDLFLLEVANSIIQGMILSWVQVVENGNHMGAVARSSQYWLLPFCA